MRPKFFFLKRHTSLLILWEFHNMHPNSALLPVLPYPQLTPTACSPKELIKNKQNLKSNHLTLSSLQHSFIYHSGIGSCSVSHSMPFSPISPAHRVFIAISHWSGLRFRAYLDPHRNSSRLSCCCPKSCGFVQQNIL